MLLKRKQKVDTVELHWCFDQFTGTFILKPLARMPQKMGENSIKNCPPFLSSVNKQPGSCFKKIPLMLGFHLILGKTQGQCQPLYSSIPVGAEGEAGVGSDGFSLFSATCSVLFKAVPARVNLQRLQRAVSQQPDSLKMTDAFRDF